MIYVRMEMWPKGNRERARLLGELLICNTGAGTPSRGTYHYALSKRGGFSKRSDLPTMNTWNALARGTVSNFPRKAKLCWDLLKFVLGKARP